MSTAMQSRRDIVARPILTRGQVAALTVTPRTQIVRWTRGKSPLVHRVPNRRGWPTIPFVGLVEAEVTRALSEKFSAQRAAQLMRALRAEHGDLAAVDSLRLVTDQSHTFVQEHGDLERVGDRQGAFLTVLEPHLLQLQFGPSGQVEQFMPRWMPEASVNPEFNGGALSFTSSRVPVAAVAGLLRAGETPHAAAREYDLTVAEVQHVAEHLDTVAAATALI